MRGLLIKHIEEESTEQCVIIRSNAEVTTNLFRDIIISSYKQLKDCNILILGGVHGKSDGNMETEGANLDTCFGGKDGQGYLDYIKKQIGETYISGMTCKNCNRCINFIDQEQGMYIQLSYYQLTVSV